ncbi:metallophosphoesterase family protein [Chryseobacterium sp. MHB01]|uniref:metallophosphoesterase family protein n=1 Tax=Chryseobacterium sp. MHB01 TaxID=3109433 RepID=UPI002AFFD2FE|nr:metallophosphoesterase family protein [Chryseobacterium sp. MHB01]MEA1848862.1 metallophosphoesterase family protein [Chryseobacterium sp. MHB01]
MKQNIFFTADHHFGHANIIKFSERPFESLEHMNEELIKRWNEKIGKDDTVYHLGDFSLGKPDFTKEILDRLNGNIHLIKGNHEGAALTYPKRFASIRDYHELRIDEADNSNGKQKIILFHYSLRTWNGSHRGVWQLYGHSHGTLPDDEMTLSFDVGVDCHNFYPVSYEEVKEIMNKKKWTPPFAPRN